jgi:hypothetical protein
MTAIRMGICALVAFAVLSFGGVQPWSEAILEIGAATLFVLWGILALGRRHAEIHWNWLYPPLIGLGAIAIVQLAFGLSTYPYLTKIELLKWGAYALLFFLALESFRTENQLKQFVWFLVIFAFAVSFWGIIQHFAFNGKLYWCVTLTSAGLPFGPFVDRDHFAGFVELTAPLGLALLLFRSYRREQVPVLLLFTIIPIGALILSASRGGIIGLFLETALLVYFARAHRIGKRELLGAAAILLVAGTFIVWLGVSEAIERFEQLTHGGITRDLRISMYHDSWRIFVDHPWIGTGWGTLIAVYPRYASFFNGLTVDHVHNDYLELLAETGLLGGFCGVAFIALLFWRAFANLRFAERRFSRAMVAGSLAASGGLLVHSLVDFNLHIPSNALIFLLVASMATTDRKESSYHEQIAAGSYLRSARVQARQGLPAILT